MKLLEKCTKGQQLSKTVVFLFSGQGSQYFQMGKELFAHNQIFRRWMLHLDSLVKTNASISVIQQLYAEDKNPSEPFKRTLYTHPAIFMVEFALAQTLIEQQVIPDVLVGYSLGEFVAATVAGMLKVEEALDLVIKQARLFETYCQPGTMLAILHHIDLYYQTPELSTLCELAAVNHDTHFVVSGKEAHIHKLKSFLTGKGILCEILPVSYAFHSAYINTIEPHYKRLLATTSYSPPQIPIFSSLSGKQIFNLSPEYFWEVVRKPMNFSQTIQTLEEDGPHQYVDVGPGGTLTNLTKRNQHLNALTQCYTILSPFHQDVKNTARVTQMLSRRGAINER
ncbi:acyltransferase domain-containing protein [Dictyobacter arantiisoli]|uniref:Polyketide biosynthesis acyltransferase PksD n=1 Tax=Dictyobacter arantiisoli TaxID=2014874 RepID=A0A5A5T6W2_9CHLR|nr:acyltransferase domain-containing protein [Dictyobacter arantiisoli]GCF07142.1 polyketide biosynthesis acyltransferase PksD [Dictyobacter arantiisoli]